MQFSFSFHISFFDQWGSEVMIILIGTLKYCNGRQKLKARFFDSVSKVSSLGNHSTLKLQGDKEVVHY